MLNNEKDGRSVKTKYNDRLMRMGCTFWWVLSCDLKVRSKRKFLLCCGRECHRAAVMLFRYFSDVLTHTAISFTVLSPSRKQYNNTDINCE